MILGIGIDIVKISRMKAWQDKPDLLKRYFHPVELEETGKRGAHEIQSLAARFAAKEAYGKALGTGLRDLKLSDIRIENDIHGKPHVCLSDAALKKFDAIGGTNIFVSLTHESDNAIAVVVLEGES